MKSESTLHPNPSSDSAPPRFRSVLVRIAIFVYAAACFSYITADPDLWGHVKFGGEIWASGSLPATDRYSYTADGLPWINHEWLAEVLFYLIYTAWDSTGLLVFKLIVGLAIVHLLTRLYRDRERSEFVYLAYFLLLVPVLAPGFMVRPHLLTYFFLTLLLFMLRRFFDGNRRALVWTPLLMLVWVNCHGGVVAGLGIYGVAAGYETIRCRLTGENRWRPLAGYFALSCLALLANPHGYELWRFFYHSLSLPREISEWNPVALWDTSYWQFKALALLALAAPWPADRDRLREFIIILAAVYFGFKHQRHTVLAGIVMTPFLSRRLAEWARGIRRPGQMAAGGAFSPAHHAALAVGLGLFVVFEVFFTFNQHRANDFKILVDPRVYPVYAVRFMQNNRLNGNILVPFDWGEYVIWHLPGSRVSIDGRFRTVYPEKVIRANRAFSEGSAGRRVLLDEYPTDIVLIGKSLQNPRLPDAAGGWMRIYEDWNSMLFVRQTASPGARPRKLHDSQWIYPAERPSYVFP
ncbi:MAG: hypothetical protein ACE5G9_03010 [Nitrospinales bacterium]